MLQLKRLGQLWIAIAAALIPLACASGSGGANPLDPAERARRSNEIELIVQNQNFNQVTVYTMRGSTFRRLGIVQGKSEGRFKTEWYHPDIQLRVKFFTGPDLVTPSQPVSPGEILELIIPPR